MKLDIRSYINKYVNPVKVVETECGYHYNSNKKGQFSSSSIIIKVISHEQETVHNPGYKLLIYLKKGLKIARIERIKSLGDHGYYIKKYPEDVDTIAYNILSTIVTNEQPTDQEIALLKDGF